MVNDQDEYCIFLRFKNCTGNIIILSSEDTEINVEQSEITQAQLALSVDPQYKRSRSRTVKQAINMVLRWRTISLGYYDYQIKRHVLPMSRK